MLGGVQKVMRVRLTIEAYVREGFQTRMRPPEQCPNCGRFHRLRAHGYYDRDSTASTGKPMRFWVRRFRCGHSGITVSCLRRFAEWRPSLVRIVGHRFGRDAPQENATAFWRRAVAVCGSAAELTTQLVTEFRTTCFRTYRCHQPSFAQ